MKLNKKRKKMVKIFLILATVAIVIASFSPFVTLLF
ncbi:MAG: hypothetical protein BWY24_00357 [Microgenomates group bacterium ADurb.Bin219]|nr:MAG: hypothetical protein BWY24_00357 [Microgenomates group bacterium ADurb.Bin219]